MASTFSLQGKLGLDARDFKKGAGEAEKAIGDVADELEELPDTAKKSGGDAGASLGGGMMKGFAALGVGGAIAGVFAMAFSREMDRQNTTKVLVGQFGKTAEEADRYGKIAGDLYAGNWGESMTEVAAAIGAVDQRLVQTGIIGEDSLEGVTEKAMALADTFDEDVSAVVRSVSQLMLNGLAPDAETAMDLVTTSLQNGGNAAGDLFDSIDEYSQHFAAFGLSAEDMMAMFSDGMANGQRDTDKMADAVKEMFIRATDGSDSTRKAFERIGLSTEEMAAKITAGGDDAREAFIDILKRVNVIEDPIDRTTVGVALLGTQFEDLGPTGVDSLLAIEQGLTDVEGATDRVVDSFVTTEAGLESLKRRGENSLAALGEGLGNWIDSAMGAPDVLDRMEDSLKVLGETAPASFEAALEAVTPYVTSLDEAELMIAAYAESVDDATKAMLNQVPPQQKIVQGYIDEALEAKKAADETAALADEVNALGGEAGDTADDLSDITYEFDKMKGSMSERSAFLNVQDGFDGIKAKALEALAAAGDQSDEAKAKLRDYEQAQISLKNEVIDYAEKVMGIPPEVVSEINALIDQGQFDEAQRRMDELERDRTATISVSVRAIDVSNGKIVPVGSVGYRAEGGPVKAGAGYVVGEEGPEFFIPDRSGFIVPAAQTAAMMSVSAAPRMIGASGGNVYNVTVHSLDAERAGQVIVNALTTFSQAGGQVPAYG